MEHETQLPDMCVFINGEIRARFTLYEFRDMVSALHDFRPAEFSGMLNDSQSLFHKPDYRFTYQLITDRQEIYFTLLAAVNHYSALVIHENRKRFNFTPLNAILVEENLPSLYLLNLFLRMLPLSTISNFERTPQFIAVQNSEVWNPDDWGMYNDYDQDFDDDDQINWI